MSCYSCGTSFGAFKKEHGCKNCGFAFCSKCLPHKLEIPKLKNEKHRVCLKCYNIMTGKVKPKEEPARYSPPENFKKRVAALQEREAAGKAYTHTHIGNGGGTKSRAVGGAKDQYKGMSQADIDIQQRLEKLREKTPKEAAAANVSVGEIDERLARLKGMDPARYKNSNKPTFHPPDRRTQQEQMNDLLDEIGNEVELDSQLPDPATEVANRLAKLKQNPDVTKSTAESNENNLNKDSLRDSQTFQHNIVDPTTTPTGGTQAQATNNTSTQSPNKEEDDPVNSAEVGRILNEAAQELEQDAQKALKDLQQDKEIMKRIQDIKERRKKSSGDVNRDDVIEDSDSENEDANDDVMADAIIKQALEESKLDKAAAKEGIDVNNRPKRKPKEKQKPFKRSNEKPFVENDDEWYDPDELPYCCICTEDAVVRCRGCDMDLYCNQCFSEGHKELGLNDHKSIKYTPPKGRT